MPPQDSFGSNNKNNGNAFDYRSLLPSRQALSKNFPYSPIADDSDVNGNNSGNNNSNNNNNNEDSWLDSSCTDLSFRERMLGFGTCLVAGYMLSFGSFWRIKDLVIGNPYPLVLHTTIGNLLSWTGSFFLVGPRTQWKQMWQDKRKRATQVYLSSLALMVLIILVHPPVEGLWLFILILVQNLAMAWYCLSYIPFAHDTIQGWARRLVSSGGGGNDLDLSSYVQAPV